MKKQNVKRQLGIMVGIFILLCLSWIFIPKGNKIQNDLESLPLEETLKLPRGTLIDGYQKKPLQCRPAIPQFTPSDEGITQVEGEDSVEICTDILAGKKYLIVIETGRRIPQWGLFDENGDSIEWDFTTQVLRLDSCMYLAKLLKYVQYEGVIHDEEADEDYVGTIDSIAEIPFRVEQHIDSLSQNNICSICFAEIDDEFVDKRGNLIKIDSIRSGITEFPAFAAGTTVVQTAGEHAQKVYVKVRQPGLISLTIAYADDACGTELLRWRIS